MGEEGIAEPDSIIAAGGRLGRIFSSVVRLFLHRFYKRVCPGRRDVTYVAR